MNEPPVTMHHPPLRGRCFVCGDEIQATLWRVCLRTPAIVEAHEGCLMRALEGRWSTKVARADFDPPVEF